jgi:hypothetical protein
MRGFSVFVVMAAVLSASFAKDELQVGDLVKQHLNSIGTEKARAAVTSRAVEGTVHFLLLNTNDNGAQDGKQVLVSEGNKIVSLLKLPNPSYHGERFVSDGKNVSVAYIYPGHYSTLGAFVVAHSEILTEGLWGGTLSTGWPLAHLDERNPKLQDQGLKKVDGRELRRIDYTPKKHTDLTIELYFEPDTFRHVMTVYALTIGAQMGISETATARQQDTHYRLEERFSDFKPVDNLTLPGRWSIQFTSEVAQDQSQRLPSSGNAIGPSSGGAGMGAIGAADSLHPNALGRAFVSISQFEAVETKITNNVQLDPKNFEVK